MCKEWPHTLHTSMSNNTSVMVLQQFTLSPKKCSRWCASAIGISNSNVHSLLKWPNGNAVCQGYCIQLLSMILAIGFCFVNELRRRRVHSLWVQLFGLMRWHPTFKQSGWYLWYAWFTKNILLEKKKIKLRNKRHFVYNKTEFMWHSLECNKFPYCLNI